jgi:hypothetical protein
MAEAAMSTVAPDEVDACAGGGPAALGAAGWLGLAAAPTFALMALGTSVFSGRPDGLCMGTPDASPLNGMALMYALMSAFHAAPWLKAISRRRSRTRRSSRLGLDRSR